MFASCSRAPVEVEYDPGTHGVQISEEDAPAARNTGVAMGHYVYCVTKTARPCRAMATAAPLTRYRDDAGLKTEVPSGQNVTDSVLP